MSSKMMGLLLGLVLILIALVLGGLQVLHIYDVVPHPTPMYYYASVGVIGLVGIILALWYSVKEATRQKTTPQ